MAGYGSGAGGPSSLLAPPHHRKPLWVPHKPPLRRDSPTSTLVQHPARQRILTATFPYYELQDVAGGPASGFVHKRRQSRKGEEVGGIVPHVMLQSLANDEPAQEEVIVDRPEVQSKTTIPTALDPEPGDNQPVSDGSLADRLLGVLQRNIIVPPIIVTRVINARMS